MIKVLVINVIIYWWIIYDPYMRQSLKKNTAFDLQKKREKYLFLFETVTTRIH